MLKLQWLHIHKFRAVKPGTRLVFSPSFNVLLGQNGTGKTTLLNLVAAVVSSRFKEFQDEEFELEYALASEHGTLHATVRNRLAQAAKVARLGALATGMDVAGDWRALTLSGELKLVSSGEDPALSVVFDGVRLTVQLGDEAEAVVWELEFRTGNLWTLLVIAISLWSQERVGGDYRQAGMSFVALLYAEAQSEAENVRFDESLEYFQGLKETRLELFHMKGKSAVHSSQIEVPRALREELHRLAGANWALERYAVRSEQVPFLAEAARLLGFESVEAVWELDSSHQLEDREALTLTGLRFLFVRPGGSRLSGQQLSYGQKRMLAFMYYQAAARSVVIADELVNGLHHGWIRACIEVLGDRQVFLTSQNPLLLDYLTFDSPEQVRSTFVLCRWEPGEGSGLMRWEDMTQEAAEDFFASYKVGFQQVGELLQSKGLW